jgi:ABC-2 type transport system ATP-binding protein
LPATSVITVEGLRKTYGSTVAVDGVSFEVREGEIFGVLGRNGAGKTTAVECVQGLRRSDSGSVRVLGLDVRREQPMIKERIGVQLQASAYFQYLTLTEILELFGGFYSKRIPPKDLLERVQLLDKANARVGQLSGGQRQRFTIAASLINDPQLVFLDEPTTGLDPQARRNVWDLVQQIHEEGRTIILTTHFMEEAQLLCQRVAIMDAGRIVALDTPSGLIRQLPVPYRIRFSSSMPPADAEWASLPQVQAVTHGNDTVVAAVSDAAPVLERLIAWGRSNGHALEHLEVLPATLEDVFLALTGKQLRD